MVCLVAAQYLAGCNATQCFELFFRRVSSSAFAQARHKLTVVMMVAFLRCLHVLADPARHRHCFFKGLRLVVVDGSNFSMPNTAAVLAQCPKAAARKGEAAFAKLQVNLLMELGTHCPLGLAWSHAGRSEADLFRDLVGCVPPGALLIMDRLYGNKSVVALLHKALLENDSHFLLRVNVRAATSVLSVCPDGSAMVEIGPDRRQKGAFGQSGKRGRKSAAAVQAQAQAAAEMAQKPKAARLRVREIRGRILHPLSRLWVEVRLWTDLPVATASADELLALYARRWDIEVFFKEMKRDVHGGDGLLRSQTPLTCEQEVVALTFAMALLAEDRLRAADAGTAAVRDEGALRISVRLTQGVMQALWLMDMLGDGLFDAACVAKFARRVYAWLAEQALHERRRRSCKRAVRQTVSGWARMVAPESVDYKLKSEIIHITQPNYECDECA